MKQKNISQNWVTYSGITLIAQNKFLSEMLTFQLSKKEECT
jgi:hypothetical protein